MLGWFKWAGRWRRQLDALVQHAGSRATSEAQMALDLGKLNDQMKRVTTVMGALVDVITTQNATINRLNDKISQLSTPTVDLADQTAVDVAAEALAAAAAAGEAVAPRDPPATAPSS